MSIRIMSDVFARYPAGGGELLLALALADHAHDDGTRIFPRVAELASKTRQGERTVRYQLRAMQDSGWLIRCNAGDGGRGRSVLYRINPAWVKGADFAAFAPRFGGVGDVARGGVDEASGDGQSGCGDDVVDAGDAQPWQRANGDSGPIDWPINPALTAAGFIQNNKHETLQSEALNPAIAVAGAIEPSIEPSLIPPNPLKGEKGLDDVGRHRRSARKPSRPVIGLKAYIEQCRAEERKPIPPDAAVFVYADAVGIDRDVMRLHWLEFKERQLDSEKRQKDWPKTFLNSVKSNWYGLWVLRPDGGCDLSTKGLQAKAWHASKVEGQR